MEFLLFYFFSGLAISSAIMVIICYNPVHSILFIILVFCNSTGIILLIEVEFLGLVFLVVYVGAIAVLFLFVVMMLNIKLGSNENESFKYVPIGVLLGLLFVLEVLLMLNKDLVKLFALYSSNFCYSEWFLVLDSITNIEVLGQFLYTKYLAVFLVAGFILLVSMVSAITITLKTRGFLKRQFIYLQVSRDIVSSVFLVRSSKI